MKMVSFLKEYFGSASNSKKGKEKRRRKKSGIPYKGSLKDTLVEMARSTIIDLLCRWQRPRIDSKS